MVVRLTREEFLVSESPELKSVFSPHPPSIPPSVPSHPIIKCDWISLAPLYVGLVWNPEMRHPTEILGLKSLCSKQGIGDVSLY